MKRLFGLVLRKMFKQREKLFRQILKKMFKWNMKKLFRQELKQIIKQNIWQNIKKHEKMSNCKEEEFYLY
mgnify:FL=1